VVVMVVVVTAATFTWVAARSPSSTTTPMPTSSTSPSTTSSSSSPCFSRSSLIGQHTLHVIGVLADGSAPFRQIQLLESSGFCSHVTGTDAALLLENDVVGGVSFEEGHGVEEQPAHHHTGAGEDVGGTGCAVRCLQITCTQQQSVCQKVTSNPLFVLKKILHNNNNNNKEIKQQQKS
jgi:hypothetical protein